MAIDIAKEYEDGQLVLQQQNEQIRQGKLSMMQGGQDVGQQQLLLNNASIDLLQRSIDYMRKNPPPPEPVSFPRTVDYTPR